MTQTPWPHQERTLTLAAEAMAAGSRMNLVTIPTGGGKSFCMRELIRRMGLPSVTYTNRRMLGEQVADGMAGDGMRFGMRAAGHAPALLEDNQISSVMTENSRVLKQGRWELHNAKVVHIDEAHAQTGPVARKIIEAHIEAGATVFGWTATPLDMGGLYKNLIVGAKNSDLRACGAHIPCTTYGPDEPDLKHIGPVKVGEDLTEEQNKKAIMRPGIFGRVFEWWERLNPDGRPAILFAPGVAESLWFAEQFVRQGVTAAHIDGERIWINGEEHPSSQEVREYLALLSRTGKCQVVCNRFVMREGIDWPWLYHCIMATVFGSVTSYLQAGGRLLRSHPSLDHVICQDHGGNHLRHGSLNADREWMLDMTAKQVAKERIERLRKNDEPEPITCPRCAGVRLRGPKCPHCGHEHEKRSRMVVQADGTLRPYFGEVFKPLKVKAEPNTEKLWKAMYYLGKNSKNKMTFDGIYHLFKKKHGYYPPKDLPFMPKVDNDWSRRVADVGYIDLRKGE